MLKTNRGFWKYFFLTIITLGIYELHYIYKLAREANLVGKDKEVGGLAYFILMSFVTIGIYPFYWNYRVCNKLADNVRANGGAPRIDGTGWLLWSLLGTLILVGPLVAFVKQIHLWNDSNMLYNRMHGAAEER